LRWIFTGKDIDIIEYAYIDKNTGLPTKTELYTLEKNKEVLQNTSLYEYNQVKDKTSIFDTRM
jgi:hypothetical protein